MVCPLHAGTDRFPDKHQQRITISAGSALESPKEVAQMNSTKLRMTAQTPSSFGMPISGHAFGVAAVATDVCTATRIVRERATVAAGTGATDGDAGLAQSYFPGTSAWRPPTC
jgi:hypothetical protein